MITEDNCIVKGIYARPQNSGYMSLKQFVILEIQDKRCLLLRFENEAPFDITQAEFVIKQLDPKGEVIDVSTLRYSNITVAPAQTYAPESAVALKPECVDFIIQLVSLVGGKYLYKFENGIVTVHYDKRGYNRKNIGKSEKNDNEVSINRRNSVTDGKFHRGIAFISLLMIVIFLASILCGHMIYTEINSGPDSFVEPNGYIESSQVRTEAIHGDQTEAESEKQTEETDSMGNKADIDYTFVLPPLRPAKTNSTATIEPRG